MPKYKYLLPAGLTLTIRKEDNMIEQEYKSIENAIRDLTSLLRPLGGRPNILEPSNRDLAKNIFKKLKAAGISATKAEIEQIAIQCNWDTKQASNLAKKFGC